MKEEKLEKIKELATQSLTVADIDIVNLKVGKGRTDYSITVFGENIIDHGIDLELKKDDARVEAQKHMMSLLKYHKPSTALEIESTSVDIEERNKETEEILSEARPMKKEDPQARAIRKGFVRGVVVQRVNAYGERKGYGVLTGKYSEAGDDSIALGMTDGSEYNEHHCKIITDVDKVIMKSVAEEQARIQNEANKLCDEIQEFMNNVIYG